MYKIDNGQEPPAEPGYHLPEAGPLPDLPLYERLIDDGIVDCDPGADDPDEQPATARAAMTASPASQVARRVVLLPRSMPVRLSHPRP